MEEKYNALSMSKLNAIINCAYIPNRQNFGK
jgi:hypothetical protein